MSKRRNIGDIVLIKTDEESFIGKIDGLGVDQQDLCSILYVDSSHDQDCREWPNVAVLDSKYEPTGEWAYHVSECEMFDID